MDDNKLLDWNFETDEISAGVYQVKGKDKYGRNVESTGTDPNEVLKKCMIYALEIINKQR